MNPTLSIIVPCYNQAAFLSETLDSILKQTFRDWECIVVNDGSPDNTSQVAGRYVELDPRFSLIETENRGVSAARNTGIRASHGEFILPLDGDETRVSEPLTENSYFLLTVMTLSCRIIHDWLLKGSADSRKPRWYIVRHVCSARRTGIGNCPNTSGKSSYSGTPYSIRAYSAAVIMTRLQVITRI